MIADVLKGLAAMTAGTVIGLGYMLFFMEVLPVLCVVARKVARVVRVVFLTVGWVGVIARLLLL